MSPDAEDADAARDAYFEGFLRARGLALLGVLPEQGLVLIGQAGSRIWPYFAAQTRFASLDAWSSHHLSHLATRLGGLYIDPSSGPPYWPFQKWLYDTGHFFRSPLGLAVHVRFGLWTAVRGALRLTPARASHAAFLNRAWHRLETQTLSRPAAASVPASSPCVSCATKPCLSACPVGAFEAGSSSDEPGRFEASRCREGLAKPLPCLRLACTARHACPVGRQYAYHPAHAAFHMRAFLTGSVPDESVPAD